MVINKLRKRVGFSRRLVCGPGDCYGGLEMMIARKADDARGAWAGVQFDPAVRSKFVYKVLVKGV